MNKSKIENFEETYNIREKMITSPLIPLIIKSSIPTIIGMFVNMLYNLTDTFWIGKLEDKSMIAAIGIVFSFISLVQAVGFWFGYGSGNMMSRLLGDKKIKEAKIMSSDGILLAIISGILITIPLLIFIKSFAAFLGASASDKLMEYTIRYLLVMLIATPFSIFSITVYNQMRLCGHVKDGMIGLLIGMVSNIILDPILIFIFNMDILGCGVATLIGQILGGIILVILSNKHGNIPVSLKYISFSENRFYHILAGGAPNFSRQGITGLTSVLLNQIASGYGEDIIAAFAVSSKITAFGYMLMIGFGQGFQPICAMNYGAKKYRRVKEAFKITVMIGAAFMVIFSVITAIFALDFAKIFSSDNKVIESIVVILQFQCISLPFLAFYAVSSMYMQNIGQYLKAFIISVARPGVFYIPLLFLIPKLLGLSGLFMVQPVDDILAFILAIFIIKKYL